MLIIGDIHITSKHQAAILEQIRHFVQENNEENNIIFVGDYVYHFTYDRKALLALFSLFVELYTQGKNVRILAGNHDWIHEHFVFAEGKWSFDLMSDMGAGSLTFVTEPMFVEVEGKEILFFPFTHFDEKVVPTEQFAQLCNDSHTGIQQSGRANSLLQQLIQEWRQKDKDNQLVIIHHRYLVDTVFPGQQARFSYKSPGLSSHWLDEKDIVLISGHLHQPFVYKNYLCTGSVRSTSPLEVNQVKFLFKRSDERIALTPVVINPYLTIELEEKTIDTDAMGAYRQAICASSIEHMQQGLWNVDPIESLPEMPLKHTTVYFRGGNISYDNITSLIDTRVLEQIKDYKIKQPRQSLDAALADLEDSSLQLDERIADRKTLLQRFLQAKYGAEYDNYYALLEELEVL